LRRPRFTLIELLVVVGIIAILAGLLLPVLSHAKEKGRQATCVNNLHECSIAHMTYATDSDHYLPPNEYVYGPLGATPSQSWDQVLTRDADYISNPQVCYCPSLGPDRYDPGRVYGGTQRAPGNYDAFDKIPPRLDADPTHVILLVDTVRVSDLTQVWFYAHSGFGCWQRIHLRHNKTANTLMFDGHIERLGRQEFVSLQYKPPPEYRNGDWYVWDRY
jgi:prepilin-type processing-associated H-X9-DG protein/prepilin-type N-terminal cleavage/methylation domain-containing protein